MPLTKVTPPQPVRAVHVEEVRRATEELARMVLDYLRRLLRGLEYPRTEWASGLGVGAAAGAVRAQAQQTRGSGTVDGVFVPGTKGPTMAQVSGKRVLLALNVGVEQPVRSVRRFYDGLLINAVSSGPPIGVP